VKKRFSHNSEQDTYSRDIRILGIYSKFGTKKFELTRLASHLHKQYKNHTKYLRMVCWRTEFLELKSTEIFNLRLYLEDQFIYPTPASAIYSLYFLCVSRIFSSNFMGKEALLNVIRWKHRPSLPTRHVRILLTVDEMETTWFSDKRHPCSFYLLKPN